MYCQKASGQIVVKKYQKAQTIVEMMVVCFIMVTLIGSVMMFYKNKFIDNRKLDTQIFLQNESNTILNYMRQHISHINFQGNLREGSNYKNFSYQNKNYNLFNSCIIFFYDINFDGCVGKRKRKNSCFKSDKNQTKSVAKEVFGIKLEFDKIKMYEDSKISRCIKEQCEKLLESCRKGKWRSLTDANIYKVKELLFSQINNNLIKVKLSLEKDNVNFTQSAIIYAFNLNK